MDMHGCRSVQETNSHKRNASDFTSIPSFLDTILTLLTRIAPQDQRQRISWVNGLFSTGPDTMYPPEHFIWRNDEQ